MNIPSLALSLSLLYLSYSFSLSFFSSHQKSPLLSPPTLRYACDEGSGELAANSGTAAHADLWLGQDPDGLRFFTDALTGTAHRCTTPVWAPSHLPLNGSAGGSARLLAGRRCKRSGPTA